MPRDSTASWEIYSVFEKHRFDYLFAFRTLKQNFSMEEKVNEVGAAAFCFESFWTRLFS